MGSAYTSIIGNTSLCARLDRAIRDNSLSHAYILEGCRGSGRHTVALRTLAAVSCKSKADGETSPPCGKCISCRKILGERSPDIISIRLEGDRMSIGVDSMRFLKSDIYLPPTDLEIKAYIIDDADTLTVQAQNALLLSLEEPPSYVMFFLICENSSALLETIRSRAPILRTEKISRGKIREYLIENDKRAAELAKNSPEEFSELVCAADGSIGYGLDLLDVKKRKYVLENRQTAKNFICLASGKSNHDKIELVFSLGTKRSDICERLSYVQSALRDLILLKKSEDAPLCFYDNRQNALELCLEFTSKKLLVIYEAVVTALDDLSKNSNVKLTLMNMLKNSEMI